MEIETTRRIRKQKKKKRVEGEPDGIGTTGAAQGEIDAGKNSKLAADIVSFELSKRALASRIFVLDVEHAVVAKDSRNTNTRSNQKR
jgi:hypothetical protein